MTMQTTGFFHNVFFWLHDGSDSDAAHRLADACTRELSGIPGVLRLTVGFPAATEGPVVERSYGVALLIEFADKGAHDAYDTHPDHIHFAEGCREYVSRVQVYDVAIG